MHMLIGTSWDVKKKISKVILERKGNQRLLKKPIHPLESLFNYPHFHAILSTSWRGD